MSGRRCRERCVGPQRDRGQRLAVSNDLGDLGHPCDPHDPPTAESSADLLQSRDRRDVLGAGKRRIDPGILDVAHAARIVDPTPHPNDRGVSEPIDLLDIGPSHPLATSHDHDHGPIAADRLDDRVAQHRVIAGFDHDDSRRRIAGDRDRPLKNPRRIESVGPALIHQQQDPGNPTVATGEHGKRLFQQPTALDDLDVPHATLEAGRRASVDRQRPRFEVVATAPENAIRGDRGPAADLQQPSSASTASFPERRHLDRVGAGEPVGEIEIGSEFPQQRQQPSHKS
jgi:hypothetical protein